MNAPLRISTASGADELAKQLVESGARPEVITEEEAQLEAAWRREAARKKRLLDDIARDLAPKNQSVPENLRQALLTLPDDPAPKDRTQIVRQQHIGNRIYSQAANGEIRRTDENAALKAFGGKARRALRRKLRKQGLFE